MKTHFLAVVVAALVLTGCLKKVDLVEPSDTPLTDGKVQILGLSKAVGSSSQNYFGTMKDEIVNFRAGVKDPSLKVVSWQWTFHDDGATSSSQNPSHQFRSAIGSITTITLVGVDDHYISHLVTDTVQIVWTLDGQPGLVYVSSTAAGGGVYNIILAAHKEATRSIPGSQYAFTGDVTSPRWINQVIAPGDTNYNFNGSLVAAASGDIGKFVAVRFSAGPGDYQFAFGKISGGTLVWVPLWGSYATDSTTNSVFLTVSATGVVTKTVPVSVPGNSGDQGNNPAVRLDIKDTSVVVYVNNFTAAASPWVQLQDSSGAWRSRIAEVTVTGFPNWGKVEVPFRQFPIAGVLVMRYGLDATPTVALNLMAVSRYYDSLFQYLRIQVVNVLGKHGV